MFIMIRDYIILAVGCTVVGMVIAFFVLMVSLRMGINVFREDMWVLGIPAVLAIIINIGLLELYRKFRVNKPKK